MSRQFFRSFSNASILAKTPAYWIAAVFLLFNILLPQEGGPNESSRLAMMAAITHDHTFSIDNFMWTTDWALSPNGHYYSNKAPGPALLGVPLYWALTQIPSSFLTQLHPHNINDPNRSDEFSPTGYLLSIALQVIPMTILIVLAIRYLKRVGASDSACMFAALALAFGSTAALLMNTYFGHAMAAIFLVAMALSLLNKRYAWMGFLLGWALLSDYGVAAVVPFVLFIPSLMERSVRPFLKTCAGGLVPAFFWVLYHSVSFGSPFVIAQQYVNPVYLVNRSLPIGSEMISILYNEVLNPTRSLLVTQPWILFFCLVLPFLPWKTLVRKSSSIAALAFILVPTLLLLIVLGAILPDFAAFDWSPGPRYLSAILPTFALLIGVLYDKLPAWTRAVLWTLLRLSILYAILVFATNIFIPPGEPVWLYLVNGVYDTSGYAFVITRLLVMGCVIAGIAIIYWMNLYFSKHKQQKKYSNRIEIS